MHTQKFTYGMIPHVNMSMYKIYMKYPELINPKRQKAH